MSSSSTQQFSGIFISYRRDDAAGHAGRLADNLVERFGRNRIFRDIDNIEPGEDFVTKIENAVGSCDILLAVIGRTWLSPNGSGRLDNPNDFVRLEIATALRRNIRVIPVLVQRASMPKPEDLPDDLDSLTRRNAVELTDLRWQSDVEQLIRVMERILPNRGKADPEVEETVEEAPVDKPNSADRKNRTPPYKNKRLMLIAGASLIVLLAARILFWPPPKTVQSSDNTNHATTPQPTLATQATPTKATPTPELKPSPSPESVPFAEPTLWTRDDSGTILRIVREGQTVKATVVRPSNIARTYGLKQGDLFFEALYKDRTLKGKAYVRLDSKDVSKCPEFERAQPFDMVLTLSADGKRLSGRRDHYTMSDDCKISSSDHIMLTYTKISP
jgi:hypothetical protein